MHPLKEYASFHIWECCSEGQPGASFRTCCVVHEEWPVQRQKVPARLCSSQGSGVWQCCSVLPDRWSGTWLCGEAVGKRSLSAFSLAFLPWEWCRHRQTGMSMMGYETKLCSVITWCNMLRKRSDEGFPRAVVMLSPWPHTTPAAACRDSPTFSPYPWATTHIHLIMKWARSGTNSAENWSNQGISDTFLASLVSWSAMNAHAEAQVFSFQL